MPVIWFIANCGGILGLCMGFSLVTVFEIAQYIFHGVLAKTASVVCSRCGSQERSSPSTTSEADTASNNAIGCCCCSLHRRDPHGEGDSEVRGQELDHHDPANNHHGNRRLPPCEDFNELSRDFETVGLSMDRNNIEASEVNITTTTTANKTTLCLCPPGSKNGLELAKV